MAVVSWVSGGCSSTVERLGMNLLFEPTPWPETRTLRDLAYVEPGEAGTVHPKHHLDLFLPTDPPSPEGRSSTAPGEPWPTLVFVHGGGWTEGDRGLEVGGYEVYGNIGRFYASRGFGVAVISYRLQPEVGWRHQVADVGRAMGWLAENVGRWGGDPERLFLSGHSAGAQLVAWTALAPWQPDTLDLDRRTVCGVVAVSGAGYDLADPVTYELGAEVGYYEQRFRLEGREDWQETASAVRFLEPQPSDEGRPPGEGRPSFLVAFSEDEWPSLQRQASLLDERLVAAGIGSELVKIQGLGHRRMAVAISQEGQLSSAILDFLRRRAADCRDRTAQERPGS